MSLKITDLTGFTIGGVQNPSITEVFVRPLVDMNKQILNNTDIEIQTTAKATISGGLFDNSVQIEGISPIYWTKYSTSVTDMNAQYLEIEEDLKAKLILSNPAWEIEIVNVETA